MSGNRSGHDLAGAAYAAGAVKRRWKFQMKDLAGKIHSEPAASRRMADGLRCGFGRELTAALFCLVGTARRAVRAAFSGATKRFAASAVAGSARSGRAGTPQRGVPTLRWQSHDAPSGFTLTELLVVLATLGILTALLLPALAGTQPRSKAYQCLNNMRQLALAWTLYASENNEQLAINNDPHANGSYLFNGSPSWATGQIDWTAGSFNTNTAYLVNDAYSLLGGYLGRNYQVFACPAAAYYVSPVQRAIGYNHRARSVAMNGAVGDGSKYNVASFGWNPATFYVAKKTTDFNNPGPSQTWVFTDEHPDSIDDAVLYSSSYPTTTFTEAPANQHDGAASITFADGHVEMHKWTGTVLPKKPVVYQLTQRIACSVTDPDMLWLARHTPQAP